MSSLGTSIANVALPTLAQSFAATFAQVQWVVLAYLLASTTLVVSVGRLGDIIGRRQLLLAGIVFFTVSSFACGIAPLLPLLIAARVAQGVGAAVMLALTMAFVGETVSKERAGSAIGLLGAMAAIGTALGPSLGGVLIAVFSWRALFFVNVPLGLLTLLLAYRSLPDDRTRIRSTVATFDGFGTMLLAFTLASYALAMTMGRGRFGLLNISLLMVAALGGVSFVAVELRVNSPLVRLSMFRDVLLRTSLSMIAIVSTVMMATLVVGPFYLARTLQLGTAMVGLTMSVGPIVAALTSVPAGRLADRFGSYRVTLAGICSVAFGALALALLPTSTGVVGYLVPLALMTAGYAIFQTANNTVLMIGVSGDQRGVIAGLLNLARNLGLISGASVMGAVFAQASGSTDINASSATSVATGMHVTFAVAAALMLAALVIGLRSRVRLM